MLNESGVRLSKGSQTRINVMENGIRVIGKGDMILSAEDIFWEGQDISMEAKEYIWLKSQDSSILLLPDAVHMKAVDVYIKSPESALRPILTEEDAAIVLGMYEEMKKSVPPIYAADGSIIRPDGYDDILYSDEMIDYFEKYVYGKGEYENGMGQPFLTLYDRWLEETYGKAKIKKFLDYLGTIDGIQCMLDVAGIFLEPADLLNAAISLCRGRWGDAALSAMCAFPLLGDWIGKGVKKGISAGTEAALKAGKAGKDVMNRLEITYKALSGKVADLRKYLDDAVEMMLNTNRYGPGYRLCLEGVGCYLDDGAELVFKIVDDTGDVVEGAGKVGSKTKNIMDEIFDGTGAYSGKLEKVNSPDINADRLAERIGGESRVKFTNDPKAREFDAISNEHIAQAKPALSTLNKGVRNQMKATFEAAKQTGKKVYY